MVDSDLLTKESETLLVPEHALKLHLRWEKAVSSKSESSPDVPSPYDEKLVPLPQEITDIANELKLYGEDAILQDHVPKLRKKCTEVLDRAMDTLWMLQDDISVQGPVIPYPLRHRLKAQNERIDKLQKLILLIDGWRVKSYVERASENVE